MAHSHDRSVGAQAYRSRLTIVFVITVSILAVEILGAVLSGSLALFADAGHMFVDASGLGLSLLAVWFAARPATPARTFGYYRLEILAAAGNAALLFAVGGWIVVEAVRRFLAPPEVASSIMVVFGLVALAGNTGSLWILRKGQAESLNVRGAFLEVLSDLIGAAAVLLTAGVIAWTGFMRVDTIASVLIGMLILPRTWRLLRDASDVLLEATPKDMDLQEARRHMLDIAGILDVHDLHAWTITSGLNVLSVHVVKAREADAGQVLDQLRACLAHHFDVDHSTFQIEAPEHRDHEGVVHP